MAKGAYLTDRSVVKWRQSQDASERESMSARAERRALKASLAEIRKKIVDKWWWDSLTNIEKTNAHMYWRQMDYSESELKEVIPGCLHKKRNMKLNEILS